MNSSVINEIRNAFKINNVVEKIPNPIPVIEVGDKSVKELRCEGNNANNTTSTTIITTPTDQDIFIVGATLSTIKDVTATSTQEAITYVEPNGATKTLLRIDSLTLTVQSECISCSLSHPIRPKRGTVINVTNTTNTGNINTYGTIYYYIDETSNA